MRDRRLLTLYLFYTVNFIAMGITTFAPKFYGEIGLSDTRIGIISASMAAVALFAQPVWGRWPTGQIICAAFLPRRSS
ncbi:MAG: hypothetical protein J6E44_08150 [Lachnospiraceae bacterium]|nr:hypothetical protein [Lachnospiraceae bacterium]